MAQKLQSIPKTWMYVLLLAVLIGPLLKPIGIPIKISEGTQSAYDVIDSLEPGSKVSLDLTTLQATRQKWSLKLIAILKHLLSKDVKVIGISFQAQGPMLAVKAFEAAGWTERNMAQTM